MWIAFAASIAVPLTAALILLIFAVAKKRERKKIRFKEEQALQGVELGIGERLHAACPGSKWRWVCRPAGFGVNGSFARIEVIYPSGQKQFMDVCLSITGYMALHVLDVVELISSDSGSFSPSEDYESPVNTTEAPVPSAPRTGLKPYDEESTGKWYNIVLIDALTALIDNLNANGEVCLHIGMDGKAYLEENGGITVVYEFGEMPDISLWGYIIEKLGVAGLFAEVQEENCIFISWA